MLASSWRDANKYIRYLKCKGIWILHNMTTVYFNLKTIESVQFRKNRVTPQVLIDIIKIKAQSWFQSALIDFIYRRLDTEFSAEFRTDLVRILFYLKQEM